ncbi:MAG: hypothetical protein KC589_10830, partial [Nanoarchaeota archaeon]|nr:hypothetical protein [Nanoarchaeota archaeon]
MKKELDFNKIKEEIIPEFSILFSTPRDMKLFRNFVLTQTLIKNNFFETIETYTLNSNKELINNFLEPIFNSEELEGNFVFLCYLLYLLPEKAENFFLEPNLITKLDFVYELNEIYAGFSNDEKIDTSNQPIVLNEKIDLFLN